MQKNYNMLRIRAFPRIHISLIGMNNDGYRLNGGIGFSIASPTLDMSFESSDSIDVIDRRDNGFTQEELVRLKKHLGLVMNREKFKTGLRCVIYDGLVQSHAGFGSNSMIYLSCVEALFTLNNRDYTNQDIISMSGRGGTSGIGINTYFRGGFVFDVGISNHGQRALAPSSAFMDRIEVKPLLMKSVTLPKWQLGICIPPLEHKTEEEEKEFFQKNCPINKDTVEKVLYEAVYGITSSLMEENFDVFCKSIDTIQQTKWKSLERNLYGKELITAESIIRCAGAQCVGMSSLGPLLYFFGDKIDEIVIKVKREMPQCVCFKTFFYNSGRIVEHD